VLNVNGGDRRMCVYPSDCIWAALVGAKILTFGLVEVSQREPSRNSERWFIAGSRVIPPVRESESWEWEGDREGKRKKERERERERILSRSKHNVVY